MTVSVTELKANLSRYFLMAASKDIYVTKYGKKIAKLTSPFQDKLDTVEELFGSLPETTTLEETGGERPI